MEMRERVAELVEIKSLLAKYEELYRTKQQELAEAMTQDRVKTTTIEVDDKTYTATFVQGTRHELDELGLLAELGDKAELILMQKLDRLELQRSMDNGTIDPSVVGKYVTERKNKPSVRITERASDSTA